MPLALAYGAGRSQTSGVPQNAAAGALCCLGWVLKLRGRLGAAEQGSGDRGVAPRGRRAVGRVRKGVAGDLRRGKRRFASRDVLCGGQRLSVCVTGWNRGADLTVNPRSKSQRPAAPSGDRIPRHCTLFTARPPTSGRWRQVPFRGKEWGWVLTARLQGTKAI